MSVTVAPQRRGRTERHRVGDEGGASADSDEPPSASQTIECTPGHPWFVRGIGWVYAGDLRVGDRLVGGEGEVLEVVGLAVEERVEKTFNFEVAGWHTYFVAEAAEKPSVWVHNASVCPTNLETPSIYAHAVGLRPVDFGMKTIAQDPKLLSIWTGTLRHYGGPSRRNNYTRLLDIWESGDRATQDQLEAGWAYISKQFLRRARKAGYTIAETHHWNFPKEMNQGALFDPRHLVPTRTRGDHTIVHQATTSNRGDPWGGPIEGRHAIDLGFAQTPLR